MEMVPRDDFTQEPLTVEDLQAFLNRIAIPGSGYGEGDDHALPKKIDLSKLPSVEQVRRAYHIARLPSADDEHLDPKEWLMKDRSLAHPIEITAWAFASIRYDHDGNLYQRPGSQSVLPEEEFFEEEQDPQSFLTSLFDKIYELRKVNTRESDERIRELTRQTKERYFSHSPNMFNKLSFPEMLIWGIKVYSIPELRGLLGNEIVGELVYELSFVRNGQRVADALVEHLQREGISSVVEFIEFMERVRFLAQHESYAEQAQDIVETIIAAVHNSFEHRIVKAACVRAFGQHHKHQDYDSVTANDILDSETIESHVRPHRVIEYDTVSQFASNAISYADTQGRPQYIASVDASMFTGEGIQKFRPVQNMQMFLNENVHLSIRDCEKLIAYYEHTIPTGQDALTEEQMIHAQTARWSALSSAVSDDEWRTFFRSSAEIRGFRKDHDAWQLQQSAMAERRNYKASIRFGILAQAAARLLLHDAERTGTSYRKETLQKLTRSLEGVSAEDISEHQFNAAESVAFLARDPGGYDLRAPQLEKTDADRQANRQLKETHRKAHESWVAWRATLGPEALHALERVGRASALVRSIHTQSFAPLMSEYEPFSNERYIHAVTTRNEVLRKIEENIKQFRSDLTVHLQNLIEKSSRVLATVSVEPIEVRVARELFDPKGQVNTQDATGLLQYLHQPETEQWIHDTYGVLLKQLDINTQIYFARYLLFDVEKDDRTQRFTRTYGIQGARTFFVTAVDQPFVSGSQIVEFATDAPEEQVRAVFAAVGKALDEIETLDNYLQRTFGVENADAVHALTEQTLVRLRKLLGTAHQYRNDPEKLKAFIEGIHIGVQMYATACRTLKDRGDLNLAETKGHMEVVPGNSIKGTLRSAMEKILTTRYSEYPEKFRGAVLGSMQQAMTQNNSSFYFYSVAEDLFGDQLKPDETLVTFLRFDDMGDYTYFGSFNSNPLFEGSKMGEALLETSLAKEKEKGKRIEAHCDPRVGITQKYIELGFAADNIVDYETVDAFHITLEQKWNERLETKRWSQREVIAHVEDRESSYHVMRVETEEDSIEAPLTTDQFLQQFKQDFLLTRYFSRIEGEKKVWYVAFERDPRKIN